MKEIDVIKHAKSYMDMLSNGINPISKEKCKVDSDLNNERLKKCFGFVSEILDRVIEDELKKEASNIAEAQKEAASSENESTSLGKEEVSSSNTAQNKDNTQVKEPSNNDIFPPNSLVPDEIEGIEVINILKAKGLIQQGIKIDK